MRLRRFPCSLSWEIPPDDPCPPSKLRSISPFKEPLLFLASGQTLKLATTALPPSPPTPPEALSAFALLEKSTQKVRAGSGHTIPWGLLTFPAPWEYSEFIPGKQEVIIAFTLRRSGRSVSLPGRVGVRLGARTPLCFSLYSVPHLHSRSHIQQVMRGVGGSGATIVTPAI